MTYVHSISIDVGHETPKEWTMMREGQQLQLVQLQSSSKEYQKVQQHFVNTLGRQPQIAKVLRSHWACINLLVRWTFFVLFSEMF